MTEIRGTTTLVGVIGWPVWHSLSPRLQNAGFAALGLDWAYVPLPVRPEALADAVRGLAAAGFAGANVTIPHKSAAVDLCDDVDALAAEAASVNTLVFEDGRVRGSSTDIVAIGDAAMDATGRRALVLGAGGSARAALVALQHAGADVTTATRHDPDWPPGGSGFDIVVDTTGNPSVLAEALSLVAMFGKLVLLGDTGYPSRQSLTSDVMTKGLCILATHDHHDRDGWTQRRVDALFFKLVRAGAFPLDGLITHEFAPEDCEQAYALVSERRAAAIGVLFDWTRSAGDRA
jgi:hypothetical protein